MKGSESQPSVADAKVPLELCDLQRELQAAVVFETRSAGLSPKRAPKAERAPPPGSPLTRPSEAREGRTERHPRVQNKELPVSPFSGHWAFSDPQSVPPEGQCGLRVPGHRTTSPKGEALGVAETELIQTESRPLGPNR